MASSVSNIDSLFPLLYVVRPGGSNISSHARLPKTLNHFLNADPSDAEEKRKVGLEAGRDHKVSVEQNTTQVLS